MIFHHFKDLHIFEATFQLEYSEITYSTKLYLAIPEKSVT